MKPYNPLTGYLHRWTLFQAGRLHVRLHHVLSADGTPFLHSHPFWYVSIVLKGGYTEQVLVGDVLKTIEHTAPALIVRAPATYHRIREVTGVCKTLFFTWRSGRWALRRHPEVLAPESYQVPAAAGLYRRCINGRQIWSKFEAGQWYAGSPDPDRARNSSALSVHQAGTWEASASEPPVQG